MRPLRLRWRQILWLRGRRHAAPAHRPPPLPSNPYRRFYTPMRSFEELAKRR